MERFQRMAPVQRLQHWLTTYLFPAPCRLCRGRGQADIGLCSACRQELPWLLRGCRQCSLPLPMESSSTLCSGCLQRPGALDQCSALFVYRPPVDHWIHAMKFRQQPGIARLLGRLLADVMPDATPGNPLTVLPVPLHRQRLAERGYNQSLEISAALRRHGYRLDPACCRKNRPTPAQSSLPAATRRKNIGGAFAVTRSVKDERFLLIDDVMTTGATLEELADTLKRAGAAHVEARVIARTVSRAY